MGQVISDKELEHLCKMAIEGKIKRTRFQDDLRAKGIAIGDRRLERVWDECGGDIQKNRRWF